MSPAADYPPANHLPEQLPPEQPPQFRSVCLAAILLDRGTQSRLGGNDPATVQRYAQDMEAEVWDFSRRPLPLLFFDGDRYYPGDGHHRILAAQQCGLVELLCEIRSGNQRQAIFYSNTEANKFHGKQLTRKDKRHRVKTLLLDQEWALMSDREIARQCAVSAPFVGGIRRDLIAKEQITASTRRKGRDGKVRETAKIGQRMDDQSGATVAPSTAAVAQSAAVAVVDPASYERLLQERDRLQQQLAEQQRQHRLELAQVTAAAQDDELRQALADDDALMQQLYNGLGTIAAALDPSDCDRELLPQRMLQAAQGIALMRRILEAHAPNLEPDLNS